MKTTIELIQTKLRAMFGMQAAGDENMAQEEQQKTNDRFTIREDLGSESSSDEEENDDMKEDADKKQGDDEGMQVDESAKIEGDAKFMALRGSSNFISSL